MIAFGSAQAAAYNYRWLSDLCWALVEASRSHDHLTKPKLNHNPWTFSRAERVSVASFFNNHMYEPRRQALGHLFLHRAAGYPCQPAGWLYPPHWWDCRRPTIFLHYVSKNFLSLTNTILVKIRYIILCIFSVETYFTNELLSANTIDCSRFFNPEYALICM